MHVYEFRCPQCAARLRCRDRSWVGRRIQCPDCAATVLVASASDGHLYAEAAASPPPRPSASADSASAAANVVDTAASGEHPGIGFERVHRQRPLRERLLSPAGIGWMVAGAIALVLIGSFLSGNGGDDRPIAVSEQTPAEPDPDVDAAEDADDVDPTIVPAIADVEDDVPPDSNVSDDPEDSGSPEVPLMADADPRRVAPLPPDPFEGLGESEAPIDVLLADDEPRFDVAGALEFPVAQFVQATPVSLLDLLYQWEEMAGIPIDATPLDEEPSAVDRLRQNVTLNLSDTTLGEILGKLLAQAGLRYDAGPNGVRLHFADPL